MSAHSVRSSLFYCVTYRVTLQVQGADSSLFGLQGIKNKGSEFGIFASEFGEKVHGANADVCVGAGEGFDEEAHNFEL